MPGLSSAPELRMRAGKAEKRKNGGKGLPANTSCVPQQRLTHEQQVKVVEEVVVEERWPW